MTYRSIVTHYPDSEPSNRCFLLLLSGKAAQGEITYQINGIDADKHGSLWFDPTGIRTHDLLHSLTITTPKRCNTCSKIQNYLSERKPPTLNMYISGQLLGSYYILMAM